MTGFGKGSEASPSGKITVEIKSLNHKTLSITCNPFNGIFFLEEDLKHVLEKEILRGKVFVKIYREEKVPGGFYGNVRINEKAAKEYISKIKSLQKKLKVGGEIGIRDLITFPGVIENSYGENGEDSWEYVEKAVKKALAKLVAYREKEGSALAKDFLARVKKISDQLSSIKKYEKKSIELYREKIELSAKTSTQENGSAKNRIEEDVAAFARNCDIAEEVTRLAGHLAEFRDTILKEKTDAGKKLDFIAQEMQREINTIGAKSASFDISKSVIGVKSEIERMREQVRNIE